MFGGGGGCADPFTPTVIELSLFTAKASNSRVKLEWVTESEIDNAGFNILRAEAADGEYVKLNDEIIPAKGSATKGAKYVFTDNIAKNRMTYFYYRDAWTCADLFPKPVPDISVIC